MRVASALAQAPFEIVRAPSLQALRCDSEADERLMPACPVPACPVGTVEFCLAWMRAHGVEAPDPVDYPSCLGHFLGRAVIQLPRLGDLSSAHRRFWVKPLRTKAFDAFRNDSKAYRRIKDQAAHLLEEPVWVSLHIDVRAEYRFYTLGGRILGFARYDSEEAEPPCGPNLEDVQAMCDLYSAPSSANTLAAYALDVAVDANGQTVLMEVNDAWALGYYRGSCSAKDYAGMLWERWRQMVCLSRSRQASAA